MNVYTSVIVFDHGDVRVSVAKTREDIRQDLIEFHNDNTELTFVKPSENLEAVIGRINDEFGWSVIVEPNWVFG